MAVGPSVPPIMPEAPYATGTQGRANTARFDGGGAQVPPGRIAPDLHSPSVVPHMTALDDAVAKALGHQDGLAPLFATLSALSANPDLPPNVRSAVEALLALRLPAVPDGESLRRALAGSGLFHEATFLSTLNAAGIAGPFPTGADLKGALAALLIALGARPGGTKPTDREIEAAIAARAKPAVPRRAGLARGQPAEPDPDLPLARLFAKAFEEADRSIARVLLHQAASLDQESATSPGTRAPLSAELPVALPGGTAILQMRIEPDDTRPERGMERPERTWRVEIGFALRGLGLLTARVGLLPDKRVVVGLWCEDPGGIPKIEAELGGLRAALEASGLEVSGIDLHLGRAPTAGPSHEPPPHRLDVAL